jgi:hypothetical protein
MLIVYLKSIQKWLHNNIVKKIWFWLIIYRFFYMLQYFWPPTVYHLLHDIVLTNRSHVASCIVMLKDVIKVSLLQKWQNDMIKNIVSVFYGIQCSLSNFVGPIIKQRHRTARLAWARVHRRWRLHTWQLILFSDEFRFSLRFSDGRYGVYRSHGERIRLRRWIRRTCLSRRYDVTRGLPLRVCQSSYLFVEDESLALKWLL